MAVDYTDYLDAGLKIFPLHPITKEDNCGCEREDCKAAGKHPKANNWQNTQLYTEEQLTYLEDFEGLFFGNQLLDHFGCLVENMLVVDVDGRNGGSETAKKLEHIRSQCAFIVKSGSGAGEHWYFKQTKFSGKLAQGLREYKGIDFKSTGYVVGAHSLHVSGYRYEAIKGKPSDMTEAPNELLELLKQPERETFAVEGVKLELQELDAMLSAIKNPSHDYERWLAVGMGLHHALNGDDAGADLWTKWTLSTGRTDTEDISYKWHSFGKSSEPITEGSLLTWAKEGGYTPPVTFVDDTDWGLPAIESTDNESGNFDIYNPPGLVGEITKWVNSRSIYPRKKLAVAVSLQIVSNAAGLNYLVDITRTTLNLITIGIAGSRTGKGAIKRCADEVHNKLGLTPAYHGKFKSSQELVRNAIHHQAVFYLLDEVGKVLEKIGGAGKSGAHYLVDLISELIAVYSEALGFYGVSGDLKREMADEADRRIARIIKKIGLAEDESSTDYITQNPECPKAAELKSALAAREMAEKGVREPFLSFFGLSEPTSFNAAIEADPWFISGGLMGRALLFEELENVPVKKDFRDVSSAELPMNLMLKLSALAGDGHSNLGQRIERQGDWKTIKWNAEAFEFLSMIEMFWTETAESERDTGSNLESLALGATELCIKVAGILCVDKGEIDLESLQWAHGLIKQITLDKIDRAKSHDLVTSNVNTEKGTGLLIGFMRHVNNLQEGAYTTVSRIRNSVGRKKFNDENIIDAANHLASLNKIRIEEAIVKSNKTKVLRIFAK